MRSLDNPRVRAFTLTPPDVPAHGDAAKPHEVSALIVTTIGTWSDGPGQLPLTSIVTRSGERKQSKGLGQAAGADEDEEAAEDDEEDGAPVLSPATVAVIAGPTSA